MATPHVAGLIAYLISVEGNSPPDAMSNRLKDLAVVDAIGGNSECIFLSCVHVTKTDVFLTSRTRDCQSPSPE
jgi:hypothetical protein